MFIDEVLSLYSKKDINLVTFCLILFRILKTMVRKFILSISQCVVDDLYKKKILFKYVSESVFFNDYHDLRNNCSCRSRKAHSFKYLCCYRHEEVLLKLFSYDVCRSAKRFCSHRSKTACSKCFDYYKLYYFRDSINICISSLVARTRYSGHAEFFNYIEAHNFFQTCRKIKEDGNE